MPRIRVDDFVGRSKFDIRRCQMSVVIDLCSRFHAYKGAGNAATYAFAVYENEMPIAAYAWQPPPSGAARSACPEAPEGVLSLSRMVAVPKNERRLKHVSKPLMEQMKRLIDRTRWPVLVTYSDEGAGHTGYVYQCSGWTLTKSSKVPIYEDRNGVRSSRYSNGKTNTRDLKPIGFTTIHRWEHWICERGKANDLMRLAGWKRVPIDGKFWKSGRQAHRVVKE